LEPGRYGLDGREMIAWLTHLQHTRAKNVWFVGILDERLDNFNRKVFQPQIDGSKTGLELPGIVDEVITKTATALHPSSWVWVAFPSPVC